METEKRALKANKKVTFYVFSTRKQGKRALKAHKKVTFSVVF
jgi:hypothetical protein